MLTFNIYELLNRRENRRQRHTAAGLALQAPAPSPAPMGISRIKRRHHKGPLEGDVGLQGFLAQAFPPLCGASATLQQRPLADMPELWNKVLCLLICAAHKISNAVPDVILCRGSSLLREGWLRTSEAGTMEHPRGLQSFPRSCTTCKTALVAWRAIPGPR